MANPPIVSVVIAAPDTREALERTLTSTLAQTFPAIEVIAVVSGQRDVPPWSYPAVAVCVTSDVNQSWRMGVSRATGRYVCFIQAGEELEHTDIEQCAFLLEIGGGDVCGSGERAGARFALPEPTAPPNAGAPRLLMIRTSALVGLAWCVDQLSLDDQAAQLWKRISERGGGAVLARDGEGGPPQARFSYEGLVASRECHQPAILLAMPFLTVGGAEAVTSQLCKQLKALGFRLLVITTVPAIEGQGDTTAWFDEGAFGVYHLPRFLNASVWGAFICYLIQQHSVGVLWQVGSSFTYDLFPLLRQVFPSLAIVDLLFNPVGHTANYLKYSYLIDHVITEDAGMKEWLLQHGESEENISVIPNGVDVNWYSPQPRLDWKTRAPRLDNDGRFVVGFIGRLSEEKGPDLFLEIASLLASRVGMEFIVYGGGPMEAALRRRAAEPDLNGRVHLLGFVSGRVGHLCCDAVVVCSRLDGRPNVVMESLAMGIPVIASRVGGIPGMMPEGDGGCLIEAGDVTGFVAAIERLADNPQLYCRLSEAGRRRALTHFSLAGGARRFADIFMRLEKRRLPLKRPLAPKAIAAAVGLASPQRSTRQGLATFTALRRAVSLVRNALLLWRMKRRISLSESLDEYFDSRYYLNNYPDVAQSGTSPLIHYVFFGFREGRDPSALFSTNRYLASNPDVAKAGINPLLHYLLAGRSEGRLGGALTAPPGDQANKS